MFKIYGLVDPRNNKLFYVGRTSKPVGVRLIEHLNETYKHTLKQKRISDIKRESEMPIRYVILESDITTEKQAFCKEVFWMEVFIKAGAELTNASIDFKGVYFFREDTLERKINRLDENPSMPISSKSHEGRGKCIESEEERFLDNMEGKYFQIEYYIHSITMLEKCNMSLEKIKQKRLGNILNKKLINHGMPIFDEEITELLNRYENNQNTSSLEVYFQRSRKSLESLIEEHYLD
ncbi:hypothetical protein ACFSJ3_15680 [Corallincola platygyrae]|uniref:GIY-YIG homing endonuclease n=1 Tax=Corallincola platygyrae TaxID=1193278 RepID=A0ABW4XRG9_9GAMM